jgi:hypothetical protein
MTYVRYFLLLVVWPAISNGQQPDSNRAILSATLRTQVENLEHQYEIQLVLDPVFPIEMDFFVAKGDPAPLSLLQEYLPIFLKEWRLYPPELIRKSQLKRVILCRNLRYSQQLFGGLTDTTNKTLLINIDLSNNPPNSDYPLIAKAALCPIQDVKLNRTKEEKGRLLYLDCAIHHELFHFLDYRISGDLALDKAWEALNPPEFQYRKFGYISGVSTVVTSKYSGFISTYGLHSVAEDKAEIFSRMIMNLHEMECRANDDAVLGRKMGRLKQMVRQYCPEINDRFWNRIRALDRPRLTLPEDEDEWALAHPTLPPLPKVEEPKEEEIREVIDCSHKHRFHIRRLK